MEIKKNENVNLEKYKILFSLFGMIVALVLVFALFNNTTTDTKSADLGEEEATEVETENTAVTVREQKVPPPPPPKTIVSDIINIVEDNVKIEDDFDFDIPDEDEDIDFQDVDFGDQIIEEEPDQVFLIVEKMPEFPGGEPALREFIAKNIKYPPLAQENDISGKVYVRFVVTKTGAVGEVQVVRSVDKLLDDEAVRVVETLPNFKPGQQRGKAVSVWYTVPIYFQLN